ncbi:MAG: 16S rRNA (cytosine(1402)-N(4))-methyltransferase RsmH [Actinobacteria bacterium]|nr:16S rRNA (cytosine(1402)-N(4))-methyltransferase RsmH [Actinomycetota bacterium]
MVDRVVGLLADAPPGPIIDCTLGAAGHAAAITRTRTARGLSTSLVGIDRDADALALARQRLSDIDAPTELIQARFDALADVLDELGIQRPAGVLYDLGISSMQVDRPDRGFSYRHEGPLDMRMDPTSGRSAADIVNEADQQELGRVISRYGEERFASRIAAAIVANRPLSTTRELAEVVRDAIPAAARRTGPHPATRTFQALRIAVNAELEALEASLPQALERLMAGGVCVVLAYHSLEDRIVKRTFADAARGCICPPRLPVCGCGRQPLVEVLTRRPERPRDAEVAANPRARAARLRAARRLEVPA